VALRRGGVDVLAGKVMGEEVATGGAALREGDPIVICARYCSIELA
jgi:uncharacterized protein with ACT and thioredoxin-like domain